MENIEQLLIEAIAEFLDSEYVNFEEQVAGVKDRAPREDTDLHIRMAAAAMAVYRETVQPETYKF